MRSTGYVIQQLVNASNLSTSRSSAKGRSRAVFGAGEGLGVDATALACAKTLTRRFAPTSPFSEDAKGRGYEPTPAP